MRTKSLLIGAVAVLALLASAWAADVTGKWVAQTPGRDGATSETTFSLKVEGTVLTGTMTNPRGESTISEGKVNGDEISFMIVRKMGENEIRTLWKGKIAGDEITFTREFQMPPGGFGGGMGGPGGGATPAGGPGGPGGGPGGPGMGGPGGGMGGPPPAIVAKRVK
jgi:hypothetical protein